MSSSDQARYQQLQNICSQLRTSQEDLTVRSNLLTERSAHLETLKVRLQELRSKNPVQSQRSVELAESIGKHNERINELEKEILREKSQLAATQAREEAEIQGHIRQLSTLELKLRGKGEPVLQRKGSERPLKDLQRSIQRAELKLKQTKVMARNITSELSTKRSPTPRSPTKKSPTKMSTVPTEQLNSGIKILQEKLQLQVQTAQKECELQLQQLQGEIQKLEREVGDLRAASSDDAIKLTVELESLENQLSYLSPPADKLQEQTERNQKQAEQLERSKEERTESDLPIYEAALSEKRTLLASANDQFNQLENEADRLARQITLIRKQSLSKRDQHSRAGASLVGGRNIRRQSIELESQIRDIQLKYGQRQQELNTRFASPQQVEAVRRELNEARNNEVQLERLLVQNAQLSRQNATKTRELQNREEQRVLREMQNVKENLAKEVFRLTTEQEEIDDKLDKQSLQLKREEERYATQQQGTQHSAIETHRIEVTPPKHHTDDGSSHHALQEITLPWVKEMAEGEGQEQVPKLEELVSVAYFGSGEHTAKSKIILSTVLAVSYITLIVIIF